MLDTMLCLGLGVTEVASSLWREWTLVVLVGSEGMCLWLGLVMWRGSAYSMSLGLGVCHLLLA